MSVPPLLLVPGGSIVPQSGSAPFAQMNALRGALEPTLPQYFSCRWTIEVEVHPQPEVGEPLHLQRFEPIAP